MRVKMSIVMVVFILFVELTGCSNTFALKKQDNSTSKNISTNESSINDVSETIVGNNSNSIKSSEPNLSNVLDISFPNATLYKDEEQFLFNTWKVDKLLGFSYI